MADELTSEGLLDVLFRLANGKRYLNGKGIVDRLCKETLYPSADIKHLLGKLAQQNMIEGVTLRGEAIGRIGILIEPPETKLSETDILWQTALNECGYQQNEQGILFKCADALVGLTLEDMRHLLRGVGEIKKNKLSLGSSDPFDVSARHLLGSAKAIQCIGDAFGISYSSFTGRTSYVVVAGPQNPEAILFVENVASFESFCRTSAVNKIMGIVTFGYGLSWGSISKELGDSDSRIIQLTRYGSPPPIKEVIYKVPCFFWGDLDQEGLSIYLQLQQRISSLKLSALYGPMVEAIGDPSCSHPYTKLAGKEGQRRLTTNNPLVAKLSKLCIYRAVDQEFVKEENIESLASHELFE